MSGKPCRGEGWEIGKDSPSPPAGTQRGRPYPGAGPDAGPHHPPLACVPLHSQTDAGEGLLPKTIFPLTPATASCSVAPGVPSASKAWPAQHQRAHPVADGPGCPPGLGLGANWGGKRRSGTSGFWKGNGRPFALCVGPTEQMPIQGLSNWRSGMPCLARLFDAKRR